MVNRPLSVWAAKHDPEGDAVIKCDMLHDGRRQGNESGGKVKGQSGAKSLAGQAGHDIVGAVLTAKAAKRLRGWLCLLEIAFHLTNSSSKRQARSENGERPDPNDPESVPPPDEDEDGVPDHLDAVPYDANFTHAPSPGGLRYAVIDLGEGIAPMMGPKGHMLWETATGFKFRSPSGETVIFTWTDMDAVMGPDAFCETISGISPTGTLCGRMSSAFTERWAYFYNPMLAGGAALDELGSVTQYTLEPGDPDGGVLIPFWGPDGTVCSKVRYRLRTSPTESHVRQCIAIHDGTGAPLRHLDEAEVEDPPKEVRPDPNPLPGVGEHVRIAVEDRVVTSKAVVRWSTGGYVLKTTRDGHKLYDEYYNDGSSAGWRRHAESAYKTQRQYQVISEGETQSVMMLPNGTASFLLPGMGGLPPAPPPPEPPAEPPVEPEKTWPWLAANDPALPINPYVGFEVPDRIWQMDVEGTYFSSGIFGSKEQYELGNPLYWVQAINAQGVAWACGVMSDGTEEWGVWANGEGTTLEKMVGKGTFAEFSNWTFHELSDQGLIAMTAQKVVEGVSSNRVLMLVPVEFITRSPTDETKAVGVAGVGPTNRPPSVELEEVTASQISVSGGMAAVPIAGVIRDAIMDNVPEGKGVDVTEATVYVNGEVERTINLTRETDGEPTLWRNYPAKLTIQAISVAVPAQGIATIRVETAANATGLKGSAEIAIEFAEQQQAGPLVGGFTRQYSISFAYAMSTSAADVVSLTVGSDPTIYTLTETGPNTLIFKSAELDPPEPEARSFIVALLNSYLANSAQAETLMCRVLDSGFSGGAFLGSGQSHISCSETGLNTGTFSFLETEPGIVGSYSYSYTVGSVTTTEPDTAGGIFPFSFRFREELGDDTEFMIGEEAFETVPLEGYLYPKLDEERQINAYIIWNEAAEPPRKELLYYNAEEGDLQRIPVENEEDELMLKLVRDEEQTEVMPMKAGSLTFVGSDGSPVEEFNPVSILTLLDLINGDSTVEIEDDSWEKVQVRPIADPEEMLIRVKSSEIEDDYFDLKLEPAETSKEAALIEVDGQSGLYESALKIVVYYSEDGHETLTEQQWLALKTRGYLAVHNLTEEAWEVIRNVEVDKTSKNLQDHHLFPQAFKVRLEKLFSGLDIHDFCIPVDAKRHGRFSHGWNADLAAILDQYTTPGGNPKTGVTLKQAREAVFGKIFDLGDPESLCRKYYVNPANPIRYGKPHISTRDKLAKATLKFAGPQLLNSSHKATKMLIVLAKKAGRGGVSLARKHKGIGIVLGSWTLLANGPKAAAAEFFDITPSGVDAMLEGQASIDFEIWDPEGSVDVAELASGDIIREGDEYWYAWKSILFPGLVGQVDRGEVDYIMPTATPGVVDIFVRFGQERREFKGISKLNTHINPVAGDPWPPGL